MIKLFGGYAVDADKYHYIARAVSKEKTGECLQEQTYHHSLEHAIKAIISVRAGG